MKIFLLSLLLCCLLSSTYSNVSVVVDLSHWNSVNFTLARCDGIVGVIHKATQGFSYIDPTYKVRREQAEAEGMLWGAYHFGTAIASGADQADFFLRTVGDYSRVLLALDIEPNLNSTMTLEQAEDFVWRVREVTGRLPVVYGSSYFLTPYTAFGGLIADCKLWVAHYTINTEPRLPAGISDWLFWQYTDGKRGGLPRVVRGIGPCDRNRYNGHQKELKKKWPLF